MSNQTCPPQNPSNVEALFHWNTDPEDRIVPLRCQGTEERANASLSSIKSTNYLMQILKDYFSDIDNFKGSLLEPYLSQNTLAISGVAFTDTETQGVKPKVIVEYGGRKLQGDFAIRNEIGYDMANSRQSFYCMWHIAYTVYVLSTEYTECMALAEEIRDFYNRFQRVIADAMFWKRFDVIEEQKPQYRDEVGCFVQPISMTAIAPEKWDVVEAAPKLKTVSLNPLT